MKRTLAVLATFLLIASLPCAANTKKKAAKKLHPYPTTGYNNTLVPKEYFDDWQKAKAQRRDEILNPPEKPKTEKPTKRSAS